MFLSFSLAYDTHLSGQYVQLDRTPLSGNHSSPYVDFVFTQTCIGFKLPHRARPYFHIAPNHWRYNYVFIPLNTRQLLKPRIRFANPAQRIQAMDEWCYMPST